MASLHTFAPPSSSIGNLRRRSTVFYPLLLTRGSGGVNFIANLNLRLKKEVKLQENKRKSRVCASNTDPPAKADDTKSSDAASSPPLATILAGIVVFLFVAWIIGSIVMWILGFILHPPQLK